MKKQVKKIDEISMPPKIEHVGFRLWRVSRQWQERFEAEMISSGHTWFGEARAALIPHLDRDGTSQSQLALHIGVSKQAVQQLIDDLVDEGIVERRPDPMDARFRRIYFTRQGLRVLADANAAKRRIEAEYELALGPESFAQLNCALEQLLAKKAKSAQ